MLRFIGWDCLQNGEALGSILIYRHEKGLTQVTSETKIPDLTVQPPKNKRQTSKSLKIFGALLTLAGVALFVYFVYSVGVYEILGGILRIGVSGFLIILLGYFVRILIRSIAWKLCVNEPYKLSIFDTMQAVIIGEALSSIVPLGILISGTAKAVAVRAACLSSSRFLRLQPRIYFIRSEPDFSWRSAPSRS